MSAIAAPPSTLPLSSHAEGSDGLVPGVKASWRGSWEAFTAVAAITSSSRMPAASRVGRAAVPCRAVGTMLGSRKVVRGWVWRARPTDSCVV